MARHRVGCWLGILVFAALLALAVKKYLEWSQQLTSEYATAGVIRDVTEFVESHAGQWPRGWEDIPGGEHARQYVRMEFDVDINELIRNPKLIHSAIVPMSGVYHTYPHAERDLDRLREVLVPHRAKAAKYPAQ